MPQREYKTWIFRRWADFLWTCPLFLTCVSVFRPAARPSFRDISINASGSNVGLFPSVLVFPTSQLPSLRIHFSQFAFACALAAQKASSWPLIPLCEAFTLHIVFISMPAFWPRLTFFGRFPFFWILFTIFSAFPVVTTLLSSSTVSFVHILWSCSPNSSRTLAVPVSASSAVTCPSRSVATLAWSSKAIVISLWGFRSRHYVFAAILAAVLVLKLLGVVIVPFLLIIAVA